MVLTMPAAKHLEMLERHNQTLQRVLSKQRNLFRELKNSLDMMKALSGILTICSSCEKVFDSNKIWKPLDVYIRENTNVRFSHGICPECQRKLYPPDS